MSVTIRLYDDHKAAAMEEGGGYATAYLCDECAEKRGTDVDLRDTPDAREALHCDNCGARNQTAEQAWNEEARIRAIEGH